MAEPIILEMFGVLFNRSKLTLRRLRNDNQSLRNDIHSVHLEMVSLSGKIDSLNNKIDVILGERVRT
jgi:hypothetical protein